MPTRCLAHRPHRDVVRQRRLLVPDADLSRIGRLGGQDVLHDLVAVAAPAPRSLAQLGRGRRGDVVEECPRRLEQSHRLGADRRIDVQMRHDTRCTESRRRVAGDALHHPWHVRVKAHAGAPRYLGVPLVVPDQVLECGGLVAAGSAPADPVDRAGEGALVRRLDVPGE